MLNQVRILTAVILIYLSFPLHGQGGVYKYQALFTLKFLKYTSWPAAASKNNTFVIGVVGSNSPVLSELITLAKKGMSANAEVVVKRISDYSQLSQCHIVFVPDNQNHRFARVKALLKNQPTLLVTASEQFVHQGADISFYQEDNRLKFKVHKEQIDRKKITVSARLLSVATIVKS